MINLSISHTTWTHILFFFFLSFLLAVLELEVKALWLLDEHSTTWATTQAFLCCNYFSGKVSYLLLKLAQDLGPPTYFSQVNEITGVYYHAWLGYYLFDRQVKRRYNFIFFKVFCPSLNSSIKQIPDVLRGMTWHFGLAYRHR
jgi:hypothetical protein